MKITLSAAEKIAVLLFAPVILCLLLIVGLVVLAWAIACASLEWLNLSGWLERMVRVLDRFFDSPASKVG